MNTGIIISVLLILVVYFICKIIKSRRKSFPVLANEESPVSATAFEQILANTDIMSGEGWWSKLSDLHQLNLALSLCQKALPVWEKYTVSHDIAYRTSSTGPENRINSKILQTTLEEIISHSRLHFPNRDNKKINDCYFNFVGPVIAIQDGDWIPPYPVKKIFLAVYYILKSIEEQNNSSGLKLFLRTSINQSLDCMDITKLYSREEIIEFLDMYKNTDAG